jgi:hypothetical protein
MNKKIKNCSSETLFPKLSSELTMKQTYQGHGWMLDGNE